MMFTLSNFYKSKEWQDLLEVLKLERLVDDELICEHCHKPITNAYDCIGHHKIELNYDEEARTRINELENNK